MPYPAIWTRSQRGQLSADYESVAFPGNTFIFLQKRKTQQFSYFRCAYCAKAMKLRSRRKAEKLTVPIVRATIEDGFLDDPDNPFHRHFCIDEEGVDTSTYAAKARYIYNKVKLELLEMPMTPRQAMCYMEAEVIANFPDQVTQQEIISRLPSDKSAKRSFARRSSVAKKNFAGDLALFSVGDELFDEGVEEEEDAADNDPRSIPLEILKPFSPRPPWICAPGRERLANFFLIYRDPQTNSRPFLVFSDIMGINLLHKCGDIVCDGNSNFYPHGFAQLYTFHAVHPSIPEEAHFAGFALLPNTSPHTYVKLFDVLSERLLSEYGDHGVHKVWHFDNHYAAISGCRAIFTNDVAEGGDQGRTANFAQLWHEHLGSLFYGTHPNLLRFIRVMREELARASIQAERIFKRPMPVRRINLDNVARLNKYPPLLMRRGEFYDDYPTTSIIGRAPGSTGSNGMGHYDYYGPAQPRMVGQCRRRLSARRRAQRQRQAGLNSFTQNRGEGGEESKETAKKANVQKMELQPEEEEEIIQVEDIEENGESAERDNVRQGTVASVEAGKTAERKQSPFVEKQEEECLIDVEEEEPLIVEEIVTDGTHLQLEMEDASETEDLEV